MIYEGIIKQFMQSFKFYKDEIEIIEKNLEKIKFLNNFKHTLEEKIMLIFFDINIDSKKIKLTDTKYSELENNIKYCNSECLHNYEKFLNNHTLLKIYCYKILFSENLENFTSDELNRFIINTFEKLNTFECYNALVVKSLFI